MASPLSPTANVIADCAQFFWNKHLTEELVKCGLNSLVLPIMQGFVAQKAFAAEQSHKRVSPPQSKENSESEPAQGHSDPLKGSKELMVTLISRRSVNRPGLRYLRRGIDATGATANTVETEQLLHCSVHDPDTKSFSFTQVRGSIPLYFSQSPYSFKPTPVLHHSPETNQAAFKRHFQMLQDRYGTVQVALLIDKQGVEAPIGEEYDRQVETLNSSGTVNERSRIGFTWFDFHRECKGMKFENVSSLINTLDPILDAFGATVEENGMLKAEQSGVIRTNCMDCLDRTNVVQSAFGRQVLRKQLEKLELHVDLQFGEHSKWFNGMWADNGDAISKQYASTAALKGDFTRTSKRDYQGALKDFSLTLSRYYSNIISDYFSQAVIDYLLGNVTDRVFEEFEANMMSADPGMSLSKIRQNAIDVSVKIVIEDQSEDLQGGWALLTPSHPNTLRTLPLEEAVLLVTDQSVYAVRFDWNTEKVGSFDKIALSNIVGVHRGTYITSTFAASDTDPQRNVGIVIRYKPGKANVARKNTRSMSTGTDPAEASTKEPHEKSSKTSTPKDRDGSVRFLAFKAPADRSGITGDHSLRDGGPSMSEAAVIKSICDALATATGRSEEDYVVEKDIISLEEARKSVGLLEQWSYTLKRYVWA